MRNPRSGYTPFGKSGAIFNPYWSVLKEKKSGRATPTLCIVRGDISLVGPRPALFNQDDLIALRTKKGMHRLVPGLTGWAQVNGRDDLPIPVKIEYEEAYLNVVPFYSI